MIYRTPDRLRRPILAILVSAVALIGPAPTIAGTPGTASTVKVAAGGAPSLWPDLMQWLEESPLHKIAERPGRVIQDSGSAGFFRDPATGDVMIHFRPHAGCLSSSCTDVLEATLTARITDDEGVPTIALTSRFVLRGRSGARICTADCMGGGSAVARLRGLPRGVYRVTLGGVEIGKVDMAELKGPNGRRIRVANDYVDPRSKNRVPRRTTD